MTIDFSTEELLHIYNRVHYELNTLKSAQGFKVSKSELNLYTSILSKIETVLPGISNIPM